MANTIKLKKSSVAAKVPLTTDLDYGELAINYTDGNLFFKSASNTVTTIASTQFVSVTGNVTGNYFIGNGSLLTGIVATGGSSIDNGTSNVKVAPSANVTTTVNANLISTVHAGGMAVTGAVSATGAITAGAFSNISGGNIDTAGTVSATGTITGGNLATGGTISATGDITTAGVVNSASVSTSGNIRTAGTISATGNITGGNIAGIIRPTAGNTTAGIIFPNDPGGGAGDAASIKYYAVSGETARLELSVTNDSDDTIYLNASGGTSVNGTLWAGAMSATGNVTGNYFIGNGSLLTGIAGGTSNTIVNGTSNVLIASANGNVVVTVNGNTTGTFFNDGGAYGLSAGSLRFIDGTISRASGDIYLQPPMGANVNVNLMGGQISSSGNVTAANYLTSGIVSATGNITGGNVLTGGVVSSTGNLTGGNVLSSGVISTSGDISATGNIGTTMGNVTGGNISTMGNVTGGNITATFSISAGMGNITGGNVSAGGNIEGGNLNLAGPSGAVSAPGNIIGGNLSTTGDVSGFSLIGSVISANGNITGANVNTGGAVSAAGTITGSNLELLAVKGVGGAANVYGLTAQTTVSAAGNITGGNVITSGLVSAATLTTSGNVLVGGDFIVNGNTTYINITDLNVEDPIIGLGRGPNNTPLLADDGKDRGEQLWYYDTAERSAFIGWDDSAAKLIAAADVSIANEIVTVNSYGTFVAGWIEGATVSATGTVTGGNIATAGTVSATGNITGGNITTAGTVSANGVVIALGNINAGTGTISGSNLQLLAVKGVGGTANVYNLTAETTVSATGDITGGNITTAGTVSAGLASIAANSASDALRITQLGTGNALVVEDSASPDTTPFVVKADGNVGIGTTNPAYPFVIGDTTAPAGVTLSQVLISNDSATTNPQLALRRSAASGNPVMAQFCSSGTAASPTAVAINRGLGRNDWYGYDGSTYINAAAISVVTDATTGTNAMPCRMSLWTAGATGSAQERVRIDSSGIVSVTGTVSAAGSITGASLSVSTGNVTLGNVVNAGANGAGNIGSATGYFNTVFAKATSAQYADLAELYRADAVYEAGTVMVIGGRQEVTQSTKSHTSAVAGVVSANPAYTMNAGLSSKYATPVAMIGRVPCRVVAPVAKGDLLVSSNVPGTAQRLDPTQYQPGCVIGKALQNYRDEGIGTIEILVGRL